MLITWLWEKSIHYMVMTFFFTVRLSKQALAFIYQLTLSSIFSAQGHICYQLRILRSPSGSNHIPSLRVQLDFTVTGKKNKTHVIFNYANKLINLTIFLERKNKNKEDMSFYSSHTQPKSFREVMILKKHIQKIFKQRFSSAFQDWDFCFVLNIEEGLQNKKTTLRIMAILLYI